LIRTSGLVAWISGKSRENVWSGLSSGVIFLISHRIPVILSRLLL
jgi:hypothetical protein